MEYHQVTINEWLEMKDWLRKELNNIRHSYVVVGYILRTMDETKAYEAEGYKSVAEFALKEHGLKPSTTSRWISINREFSLGGYDKTLDPKYADMNASQLIEMLGLPVEDRNLVTSGTSREDIREMKRFNRDSEGGTSPASGAEKAFCDMLDKDKEIADRVRKAIMSGHTDAEHMAAAVAPSGSKMYRAGTQFLAFKASGITVKTFGGGQESVDWGEFATAAQKWIERKEKESGADRGEQDDVGGDDPEGKGSAFEVRDGDRRSDGCSEPDGESGDEESEPDHDSAEVEDAGSVSDEETEDSDEGSGQLETGDDADNSGDAQAEPVAEEPEETGMNPPVAPAQQKPKSTADISKFTPIVDEKGQPAPEEQSLDIRALRVEVSQMCRELSNNVTWRNWGKALECVEGLMPKLRMLDFHDK